MCPHPKVYLWGTENNFWVSVLSLELVETWYLRLFCSCHFVCSRLAGCKASGSFSHLYLPSPHRNARSAAVASHIWLFMGPRIQLGSSALHKSFYLLSLVDGPVTKNVKVCCTVSINVQRCFSCLTLKSCRPRMQFIQGYPCTIRRVRPKETRIMHSMWLTECRSRVIARIWSHSGQKSITLA